MSRVELKSIRNGHTMPSRVFLLVIVWGLTTVPGGAQKEGSAALRAADLTQQAQELLRNGQPGKAQEQLQKAIAMAPDSVQAHVLLADADAQLGNVNEAIRNYEIVLKLSPNYPSALYNLGILQLRAGRFDAAAGYLLAFRKQSPKDLGVLLPLAQCLFELGRKQEGLQAVQTAVAAGNDSPVLLMKAGELLLAGSLVEQSAEPLKKALELDPSSDECRLTLALAETRLHHYKSVVRLLGDHPKANEPSFAILLGPALCRLDRCREGVRLLENASQTHADDRRLYLSLAEAYTVTADNQKAVQILKSAHSRWPGDAEIRIALAQGLFQAGDPASASAILEADGDEPLTEGGLCLLAQCYLALNRLREAEQVAQRAASGNAPEEASLLALANIYQLQGRDPEVITLFERHHHRFSDSPRYLFTLALSYYNRGSYLLALDLLAKANSLDPALAQSQYLTGNCLSSLGKLEDAIPHYQTAVSLAPDNFLYHFYLGFVLSRVGKKDLAEKELKRSIELNGSHAPARYELGKIYFDTGRYDLARVELEQATQINPDLESSFYLLSRVYASLGRNDEASAVLKQFRQIQQKRREEERAMKQRESGNEDP